MKRQLFILALGLTITVMIATCKEDNPIPPEEKPQINLTLEDTSCTEAWIKLTTANISLPVEVILKQDDSTVQIISLSSSDSLLYFDSLLPNHTYEFQSIIQSINQSSNSLTVTTMDTTYHEFTWQTWTFGGQAGSCTLYDVAIIDENDMWAVGEIYLLDTTGVPDPNAYNAVHWDGSQWGLKRINMLSSCNPVTYPPLKAICAFSDSNIIVTSGGSIGWFNGVTNTPDCGIRPLLTGSINKLWGASGNDFYAVGNEGNIAHYQNGQWSRIESGTGVDLLDVYGDYNGSTIFIGGYKDQNPTVLLKVQNNQAEKIFETEDYLFNHRNDFISGAVFSLWLDNKKLYALTWYDLYRTDYNTKGKAVALWKGDPQDWDAVSVRGNRSNDIITCGVISKIWHYNGISWHTYNELINTNDRLKRIDIKGDITAAVGYRYESGIQNKGLIIMGKR